MSVTLGVSIHLAWGALGRNGRAVPEILLGILEIIKVLEMIDRVIFL